MALLAVFHQSRAQRLRSYRTWVLREDAEKHWQAAEINMHSLCQHLELDPAVPRRVVAEGDEIFLYPAQ